jgi:biopolymer transport protein ExbB
MQARGLVWLITLMWALPASAWWSDDWGFRKPIALDTTAAGANLTAPVVDGVVLVRLHLGNFAYFGDTLPNGDDLRFVAGDDLTPLAFHIESYDPVGQVALVWVRLPQVLPQSNTQAFYMYYGNASAPAGGLASQTYDKSNALVVHFDDGLAPRDLTAYGNTLEFRAIVEPMSLIGFGARFAGQEFLRVASSPTLIVQPQKGWTFSTWIRIDEPQSAGVVAEVNDPVSGRLTVGIDGTSPYVESTASGAPVRVVGTAMMANGTWHHLAVTVGATATRIFVDGVAAGEGAGIAADLAGDYRFGRDAAETGALNGVVLDEIQIASVEKSPDAIALQARGEGMMASLLVYGEDGQRDAGHSESYFLITLRNVTVDGWVVIAILGLMGVVSWYVMAVKGLVISRIRKDNDAFIRAYHDARDLTALYQEQTAEEREEEENPLAGALTGDHSHFKSSSLYHLYRAGIKDVRARLAGASVGAARATILSGEALNSIRASLDAANVRETQRLNNQMVLLTLAISGGPFLGLLGTVVGVMITFAAIAASGDVNVNAIAPGIAAALVATVAGLVVAIPALFGYNYIGSRIKEISADNRVFLDEFLANLAETYADG